MRGRYSIPVPMYTAENRRSVRWEEEEHARPWHAFVSTCKSLARDGLNYEVFLEAGKDTLPRLTIRAWGTPIKRKVKRPPSHVDLPAKLTLEQCQGRLGRATEELESEREHVKGCLRANWLFDYSYWPSERNKDGRKAIRLAVGRAVARIIRRNKTATPWRFSAQDYADMDAAVGTKVDREYALGKYDKKRGWIATMVKYHAQGWFEWPGKRPKPEVPKPPRSLVGAYLEARGEVEYWQEMVRLVGGKDNADS